MGPHGETTLNSNGERLLDFCSYHNLSIMNGYFKHKQYHRMTWSAKGSESIVDYLVANKEAKKEVMDVRVFKGYDIATDYHFVESSIRLRKKKKDPRINKGKEEVLNIGSLSDSVNKWHKRRMEPIEDEIPTETGIEKEYNNVKQISHQAVEEALGKRNRNRNPKKPPTWNEQISELIKEKQQSWRKWLSTKKEEDRKIYHEKRQKVQTAVRNKRQESLRHICSKPGIRCI